MNTSLPNSLEKNLLFTYLIYSFNIGIFPILTFRKCNHVADIGIVMYLLDSCDDVRISGGSLLRVMLCDLTH